MRLKRIYHWRDENNTHGDGNKGPETESSKFFPKLCMTSLKCTWSRMWCVCCHHIRRLWSSMNKQRPRHREFWKIDPELYLTEERTGSHVPGLTVLLLWSVRVRAVLLRVQGEELDHHATALHDLPRVCPRRLCHHACPIRTAVACPSGT